MLRNLTGWHALVILAIVLLVFGAAKLPGLARSVGQSLRILKTELHENDSQPTTSRTVIPGETVTDAAAEPVAAEPVAAEPVGTRGAS